MPDIPQDFDIVETTNQKLWYETQKAKWEASPFAIFLKTLGGVIGIVTGFFGIAFGLQQYESKEQALEVKEELLVKKDVELKEKELELEGKDDKLERKGKELEVKHIELGKAKMEFDHATQDLKDERKRFHELVNNVEAAEVGETIVVPEVEAKDPGSGVGSELKLLCARLVSDDAYKRNEAYNRLTSSDFRASKELPRYLIDVAKKHSDFEQGVYNVIVTLRDISRSSTREVNVNLEAIKDFRKFVASEYSENEEIQNLADEMLDWVSNSRR